MVLGNGPGGGEGGRYGPGGYGTTPLLTDKHVQKHYLPVTLFAGGNNVNIVVHT